MTTRSIIEYTVVALIALALWGSGYLIGCRDGKDSAEPVVRTKIQYVDREITKRDTVTVDRPVLRRIYERTTDTVVVRVPMPSGFDLAGLIHPTPIQIDGRNVTLTYFSPDSLRFMQDTYELARRRWGLWLDAGAGCMPTCFADARLNVRYRALTAFGGYGTDAYGNRAATFGVRLKIVGWR